MFKLDLQSRLPIYQQLQNRISELILLGVMEPGEPLPSVRNMARELGVNPNTVAKAYQELERLGVIYSIGGKGCFVSGTDEFSKQARAAAAESLRKAAAEARLSGMPLDEAVELLKKIYTEEGSL